jgi:hypothetical protein
MRGIEEIDEAEMVAAFLQAEIDSSRFGHLLRQQLEQRGPRRPSSDSPTPTTTTRTRSGANSYPVIGVGARTCGCSRGSPLRHLVPGHSRAGRS